MGERSLAEIRRVALGGAGRLSFPADMETVAKALESAEARVKRLEEALTAVLADIAEYERINNLAPSSGRAECWQSVAAGYAALAKEEDRT